MPRSNTVLIIFKYANHLDLINRIVKEMSVKGIKISAVNNTNFSWVGEPYARMWLIKLIQKITRVPKIRGLFLMLFKEKILKTISMEYEVVDFHSFNVEDIKFLDFLNSNNKKTIITFWGSDILCASDDDLEVISNASKSVSLFRAITPEIFQKLQSLEIKSKVSLCLFGVHGVDMINDFNQNNLVIDVKELPPRLQKELLDNPIVVVIGNNGNKRQNHLKIIEDLQKYDTYLCKLNVLLVFPLGYSASKEYKKEIDFKLKELNLRSIVINEYLSSRGFSTLTYLTHVYITMQESDAFSFYLQEQLASGTIVLYGDWLPYKRLESNGIFACETSFENIGEKLVWILENYESLMIKANHNKTIVGKLSCWNYRKEEWFDSYKTVLN